VVLVGRASDRFGDNGLITVAIAQLVQEGRERALEIETWVMSCRVLGRRIEHAMRDALVAFARRSGASALVGHYRPTARNGLVKDHYRTLGFALESEGEGGATDWRLEFDSEPPAWRSPFASLRIDV
jgi:FkbH-like protein